MKCEKCNNEFPSKYYFAVPNVCKECFSKMSADEQAKYFNIPIENHPSDYYKYFYRVGFGPRLGAALLDIGFTFSLLMIVMIITGVLQEFTYVLDNIINDTSLFDKFLQAILPLSFIVTFMYYAFEIIFAATPGKMILGLKIVDENMHEASVNKLAMRFLYKHLSTILSLIAFLLTIESLDIVASIVTFIIWGGFLYTLSPKRQGVHDLLAGTIVLRRRDIINDVNELSSK